MSVRVRVTSNRLPEISRKLPIARRVILGKRGEEMRAIAARLSRVDTGRMRDGWEWRESHAGGLLTNDVSHAIHNEYGTRFMSAAPMARPAAEQVFPRIVSDFESLEGHLK